MHHNAKFERHFAHRVTTRLRQRFWSIQKASRSFTRVTTRMRVRGGEGAVQMLDRAYSLMKN